MVVDMETLLKHEPRHAAVACTAHVRMFAARGDRHQAMADIACHAPTLDTSASSCQATPECVVLPRQAS